MYPESHLSIQSSCLIHELDIKLPFYNLWVKRISVMENLRIDSPKHPLLIQIQTCSFVRGHYQKWFIIIKLCRLYARIVTIR